MTTTQIVFAIGAAGLALAMLYAFWLIITVTDEMPHIRKADHFDGEIEHG